MPVAIVTGSNSGIGRRRRVRRRRHLGRGRARRTRDGRRGHGHRAEVRRLDLSDLPSAAGVIDQLADSLGSVDVLVNNSGTSRHGGMLELSYDDWRHTLTVDLDGAFLCAQRAGRRMVEQGRGARIVNVTSVHEHAPISNGGAYTVAKHGLGRLTKQLALELGRHGITVNSVAPGMVATPMTGLEDEDPAQQPKPAFPIPRPGDARQIASCISWLCSPAARWTTGASFLVDGGFMLVNPSAQPKED